MRKTNCFPTLRPAALSLLTVLLTVLDLSHANAMSAIKSIKTLLPATRPRTYYKNQSTFTHLTCAVAVLWL